LPDEHGVTERHRRRASAAAIEQRHQRRCSPSDFCVPTRFHEVIATHGFARAFLQVPNRQAYYAARAGGGPGHLLFLRDGTLMAQRFDPDRLALSGEAVSIAEGVESFVSQSYGLFSVSDTGTLAYRSGVGEKLSVTWLDQKGRLEGVLGDTGEYSTDQPGRPTSWSKDCRYLLFTVTSAKTLNDIWVLPDPVQRTQSRSSWLPPNSTMRTATSHPMAAGSPAPQNVPTPTCTSGRSRPAQLESCSDGRSVPLRHDA